MLDSSPEHPTPMQTLLLQAVCGSQSQSVVRGLEWLQAIDLDSVDPASFNLLPGLYLKLSQAGLEHPLLPKLKGMYRKSWYGNQLLFHTAQQVISGLQQSQISVLVLKGVALAHLYFPDQAVRPNSELDLLIPLHQVDQAIKLLRVSGWQDEHFDGCRLTYGDYFSKHFHTLNNASQLRLNLQWRLGIDQTEEHHVSNGLNSLNEWQHPLSFTLGSVAAQTLSPEIHFLSSYLHDLSPTPSIPLLSIFDCAMILKTCPAFDWSRILELDPCIPKSTRLLEGLIFLREQLDIPVPDFVVMGLQQRIVNASLPSQPDRYNVPNLWRIRWNRLLLHYRRYRLTQPPEPSGWQQISSIPEFLRAFWQLPSVQRVPGMLIRKSMRWIREAFVQP